MKKIMFLAMAALIGTAAGAQNVYDAMAFSQNNYYGTARSMALSNAVTAVGGDLGTIGINPAGSAVAGYGQFAITPGVSINSTGADYYASVVGDAPNYADRTGGARFSLPNVGFSMNFDTGNDYGIKAFSCALVSNVTNMYQLAYNSYGANDFTSKFGEYAAGSTRKGYTTWYLNDKESYYLENSPWDLITAYRANLFSDINGIDKYAGNSEVLSPDKSYHYVPGRLNQNVENSRIGYKTDIVLNFGMNISDRLFLGFNLGLPTMRYRYDEYYSESAQNPELFPIHFEDESVTYFRSGTTSYSYANSMSGIYGKIGAIFLPTDHLRIGLAFQSPSSYTMRETWQYSASSRYDDSFFNGSQTSPLGEYSYRLRTPYVVDVGLAYTFGSIGFLSVDYELMDYSIMKFKTVSYNSGRDYFPELNSANKNFCGLSHNLRVGAEFKPTPAFAVRLGYSFLTTPEKYSVNDEGTVVDIAEYLSNYDYYHNNLRSFSYYKDYTQGFSLGFGYSSNGSFYADIAARLNLYPGMTFNPYYSYDHYDELGLYHSAEDQPSPSISVNRKLVDVALTIGWRF